MAPPQASPDTVTSVISLPSSGLAWPVHRLHLKLASDFRQPGMPLHFLWIQLEQPPQKMEFVRMPLRPMPQGSLPEFWSTSSPDPDISTLVLPMSTQSPFPSMLVFQRISFYCNSSKESVMMTKSSAYRDILYETPGRGLPEPWLTVRGSTALVKSHFHTEICFWCFHACPVWASPATRQHLACEEHTRWHVWVCDRMPMDSSLAIGEEAKIFHLVLC